MVGGRHDEVSANETVEAPLFNALATPPADMRHPVFDCRHGLFPYQKDTIREVLAWLDEYPGPVERVAQ